MKSLLIASLATLAVAAHAQNLYSNQSTNVNVAQLEAVATTRSGVAAASGAHWSEVQANGAGVQPESNTSAGFTVANNTAAVGGTGTSNFRLADDFTVTGAGWNVTGFKVYAYQTGSAATANPFTGGSFNLWSGRPGDSGSTILTTGSYGGFTNTIAWADGGSGLVHRIFNTNSPGPGTAPGTTRIVREISFNLTTTLAAGTYWIDWQVNTAGAATAFAPSTTHLNSRGVVGANGRQSNAGVWSDMIDTGNPATAADVAQDLPFIVTGTPVPEPATMAVLGLGALAALRRRKKA